MNSLQKLTEGLWTSNEEAEIYFFIRDREPRISENNCYVKTYFEADNSLSIAIYDGAQRMHSMYFYIHNFTDKLDILLRIREIFVQATSQLSGFHILKQARQALEDIISMLPTFRAFL